MRTFVDCPPGADPHGAGGGRAPSLERARRARGRAPGATHVPLPLHGRLGGAGVRDRGEPVRGGRGAVAGPAASRGVRRGEPLGSHGLIEMYKTVVHAKIRIAGRIIPFCSARFLG